MEAIAVQRHQRKAIESAHVHLDLGKTSKQRTVCRLHRRMHSRRLLLLLLLVAAHALCALPVAADVDDVIHTPCDPYVAVLVTTRAITCSTSKQKQGRQCGRRC